MTTKINAQQVNKNDLMAFVYYARVEDAVIDTLRVYDVDNKNEMLVQGQALIENSFSADQFQSEEKVGKTHTAEILISARNRPLTVCFLKANGSERILRGRLIKPEPLLGRSTVEDLDLIGKDRLRLVDHRTIKWIIVEGMKYIVK